MPVLDFVIREVATPSSSSSALPPDYAESQSDAQRIAHVTSAVIGCLLGAALAGAVFAFGIALLRFRRRKLLQRSLYPRVAEQIDRELAGNTVTMDERERLIEERLRVVTHRAMLNARGGRPRRERRPMWGTPPPQMAQRVYVQRASPVTSPPRPGPSNLRRMNGGEGSSGAGPNRSTPR